MRKFNIKTQIHKLYMVTSTGYFLDCRGIVGWHFWQFRDFLFLK